MSAKSALAVTTPRAAGFRQPAEWDRHEAVWLAWPSHRDLWGDALGRVRSAFTAFASATADVDPATGRPRGERLDVLVPDAENEALAKSALAGLGARFHRIPFGDIWLRDTAPVFLVGPGGMRATASFGFNGWGGKYVLEGDDGVSSRIAEAAGLPAFRFPWVLEGGSVEVDGEGTCLTTRQCLLNPNRNTGMSREATEAGLRDALSATTVLWLGDGLLNDHTDGHVDTLARFVAPGVVVCMGPARQDDANRQVLVEIERDLRSFRDAKGRALNVMTIPSPGVVRDADGEAMPASYVNFYIANTTVVVPAYGVPNDEAARAGVARLFPTRRAVSVPARDLLEGGGAFHCITQQEPA
ncbi:MAG TPA: agmatine deiminase family protein [Thermoanaerobaculia bacterium]|nr:agmatine deiminase family protein [Thermoanaerobaculia bacterium]